MWPSCENSCDGAQAYFDDLWEVTRAHPELDASVNDAIDFFLAYFQNSNPPPILEEWVDAQAALWGVLSDDYSPHTDYQAILDAIDDAEDKLEDECGDYPFSENFWG
jgi:hypothetical protein